jgi:hypothetical protein
MAANPKPSPINHHTEKPPRAANESCNAPIDPTALAGSRNSLGSKSDCNGRPSSDGSVVEAMDEAGPLKNPPNDNEGR